MNTNQVLPWEIALFPGMTSVVPKTVIVKSESQLEQIFSRPPIRDPAFPKKQLPCWSPAIYENGDKRGNANVKRVTTLVYDFDHTTEPPEKIAGRLGQIGVVYAIHTTWSHRSSEPRYRVVLFLTRPLLPSEYSSAWENGLRLIGYDAGVDRQARNISRHYALPSHCDGEEYVSYTRWDGRLLNSDRISQAPKTNGSDQKRDSSKPELKLDMSVVLDSGGDTPVSDVMARGPGKYKCACPFQADASAGSAFVRVTKDGRCFLQCTSERHDHEGNQFWLSQNKSNGFSSRSIEDREARLGEVPQTILEYAEVRLAYNALQGVFYRHADGAWQISLPMRKETLQDHFIGLLPKGCNKHHASALIDHIISRQVYGFDCQPSKDPIVTRNEIPMLNLYAWPDLSPVAGDWPRIEKVLDLLCAGDSAAKKWLLHWSASLIQNPERRSMVAVLVLSPQQGIGKSLYGRLMAEIIGKGNAVVVSNRALRDNFNSHYVTSLLVLADEVGIEKNAVDVIAEIKASVTDDRVHCSAPYAARTTVVNRMTWWMTSNHRRPFLIEADDRRFTILAPQKAAKSYRMMLRDCFDPKTSKFAPTFYCELQAFAEELHRMTIDWDLISRPYNSAIKSELQNASMSSVDAFVFDVLQNGVVATIADYPPPPAYFKISDSAAARAVPCETLYGSYREWCQRKGRSDLRSETILRLAVRDVAGVAIRTARISGKKLDVYCGIPAPPAEPKRGQLINIAPQV